jgi:hypothetical protein
MVESPRFDALAVESFSPVVLAVLQHLCEGRCHSIGGVLEWCETRGDCSQAVVCPACHAQFVVDDDELAELLRWTNDQGQALVCGVRWE